MHTPESNGQYGYIYFPIEYPLMAFASVISHASLPTVNLSAWLIPVDKSKFLDGCGNEMDPGPNPDDRHTYVISVGF